jgi:sterol desaturase/sphingolipid hydroxylase (fatty acid hydroxylase superfamily)
VLSRDILLIAALAFLILIFLEFIYSKVVLKKNYYSLADAVTSINQGVLSQIFGINSLLMLIIYTFVYNHFRIIDFPLESVWAWVIALLIYDFLYYWTHRLGHEFTLFWSNHVIHHSSEYFNLTTAIRQPGVIGIHILFTYLPLAILGVKPQGFIILGIIDLYYQFWVHTECIGRLGILDKILVTPRNHAIHHAVNPSCINMNYGGILIIWDRLFGTYSATTEQLKFGTTKPLKSWNPIRINLETYYLLIRDIVYTKGFLAKLKMLMSRTGERSISAKLRFPIKDFDFIKHRQYIVRNRLSVNVYAIINLLICLCGFFMYLVNFSQISLSQSFFYLLLFLLLAISRGKLLNRDISLNMALMFDMVIIASFATSLAYTVPGMSFNLYKLINIIPIAIVFIGLITKERVNSYNRFLFIGLAFCLAGGILSLLPLQYSIVGFFCYALGYISYGIHFFLSGGKSFSSSLKFLFIPILFSSFILIIMLEYGVALEYVYAAIFLLLIVSWLVAVTLRLSCKHGHGLVNLISSSYFPVVLGSMFILLHDGMIFINLTIINSSLFSGIIMLCYGIGQYFIINYAPND